MKDASGKSQSRRANPAVDKKTDGELRILVLEDNPDDAELIVDDLRAAGIVFTARQVETGRDFSEALAAFSPGLILSDYDLPGFTGTQALKIAKEICPDVPFILVTGAIGEERAIEILTSGATDYVLKNRMSRLAPAVLRALQEVRERKEREKAELSFQTLVEQVPAVTYQMSADSDSSPRYLYVSPQSEAIIGIAPSEILADPGIFKKRLFPADREPVLEQMKASLSEHKPFRSEYRVVKPDGRIVWVRDEAVLVRDESGNPLYFQGIITDITGMKEAQEALRRAHDTLEMRVRERTEELEAFTSSVSHDLHGPVWMLDGYIKMLIDDLGEKMDSDLRDRLGVIWKTVKHMDRLIDDLLALSRVNRTELDIAPVDMREIILDAWQEIMSLNPGKEIVLTLRDLPGASGDRNLIRQAVYNLLSNAVKFTASRKSPEIEVGGRPEGQSGIFYVRDNGVGFDMKQYDKLFGLFQRLHGSRFAGTGVGLTIVKRIIQRHGGSIRAEGKVNHGATFIFSLPA